MNAKKYLLFLVGCSLLVFGTGCVAVLVGLGAGGSVAYVKGDLEAVLEEDITQVYKAALKALYKLEISTTKKEKDALAAVIVCRTAQDKKITITLKATENDLTTLSIRVGVFGNKVQSQRIYEEIKNNL